MRIFPLLALGVMLFSSLPAHAQSDKVYVEDMTWMDVRDRLAAGATTIIIPTGGTEQNGPALPEGKHNFVMAYTSGEIARRLSNAMAAPVLAYVPEGRIDPPEGHMRFPGTISVQPETFAAVLEDTARSFKQHGFRLICFVGDHGGSQPVQKQVAEKLEAEWGGAGVHVINVSDYYANNGQAAWLKGRGVETRSPEAHAGLMDTAEMLSVKPNLVKKEQMAAYTEGQFASTGAAGDETSATATIGKKLLDLKITAAVEQIRRAAEAR